MGSIGLDVVDFSHGVAARPVLEAVDDIATAEREGFASVWVPVLSGGPDPLVVCVGAASRTTRMRLATGVIRTWAHHPVELARLAASAAVLCGGRLVLGVGVSHKPTVEANYGM